MKIFELESKAWRRGTARMPRPRRPTVTPARTFRLGGTRHASAQVVTRDESDRLALLLPLVVLVLTLSINSASDIRQRGIKLDGLWAARAPLARDIAIAPAPVRLSSLPPHIDVTKPHPKSPLRLGVAPPPVEFARAEPGPPEFSVPATAPSVAFAVPETTTPELALPGAAPFVPPADPVTGYACLPVEAPLPAPPALLPGSAPDYGLRLAAAARAQTVAFTVYDDRYRRIGYPMGDLPSFYGVCTDVVIRAYRALGLDLQVLVHQSRLGSGDASIDHRRTETLRRFFTRYGTSLEPSEDPAAYLPGDIVTYYRPNNRRSRSHIAVIADRIGPSGRPMIVHNRGQGVQLEDTLFMDEITGHYRFTGMPDTAPGQPAAQSSASLAP